MRSYRVTLESPKVGTLCTTVLACWYTDAADSAVAWANADPEHGPNGPWREVTTEVTA